MDKSLIQSKISCAELQRHDHACVFFSSDNEFIEYTAGIIRRGIKLHEQCFVVTDALQREEIKKYLFLLNLFPDQLLSSGQLRFYGFENFYLAGGHFSAQETIHLIERSIREAMNRGFAGLRGLGEISGSIRKIDLFEFLRYENEVQNIFHDHPLCAICAYRTGEFQESELDRILQVHPHQIMRNLSFY